MAYAAVISLKNTIESLSNSSDISLVPPTPEIIGFAYRRVGSLEAALKRLDDSSSRRRKRVNFLDEQIREVVYELEDKLESHVTGQIASQSNNTGSEPHLHESIQIVEQSEGPRDETRPLKFSVDLKHLQQEFHSFIEELEKMEKRYINELCNPLAEEEEEEQEEEEEDAALSRIFGGNRSKMVGLSDEFFEMKDGLTENVLLLKFGVFSFIGMIGMGKTTLAKAIYDDPDISKYFNFRAWVSVGRKCQLKDIQRNILARLNPNVDDILKEGDEEIAQYLKESLKGWRYLIVLDGVWDKLLWHELGSLFPENENGSRVLLTTRLHEIAPDVDGAMLGTLKMRLLDKEESWHLLCEKVFGEQLCPHQLEKAGKKIAESCEGLPLTIVTVADLLSKAEKTPEYWNKVAEKKNSIFTDAYYRISEVLFSSYKYLEQHLKACFLYMGIFPLNYRIPRSKLINLWIAEGFLEQNTTLASEDFAMKCLKELVSNSLVMVYQNSKSTHQAKTWGVHSSMWYLLQREARKNNFFHVLNNYVDSFEDSINSQHRLCIHNNTLLGIKDVYNSMECAITARSILCFGPYHQYPVPICLHLRLLRIVDALAIRFYEFPMEVLQLVQLRYLAFTYNGQLPSSISKLWNLQFLIVRHHLSIKSSRAPLYLPIEIWNMKELKHLQIMGNNLPDLYDAFMVNLITLLDVSASSCTKGIFEKIPNLKKLGIQIELVPYANEPLRFFDHISYLNKLEALKCDVVNPWLRIVAPPTPFFSFPPSLKKLSLSGFGYPWEEMGKIALLPNLEVLKLRNYAFRGPKWEIEEKRFSRLTSLLIEDTDLVQWRVGHQSLPCLTYLSIKHCYKFEEIHWRRLEFIAEIEVVDCNLLRPQLKGGERIRKVYVHSSWDDWNLKR